MHEMEEDAQARAGRQALPPTPAKRPSATSSAAPDWRCPGQALAQASCPPPVDWASFGSRASAALALLQLRPARPTALNHSPSHHAVCPPPASCTSRAALLAHPIHRGRRMSSPLGRRPRGQSRLDRPLRPRDSKGFEIREREREHLPFSSSRLGVPLWAEGVDRPTPHSPTAARPASSSPLIRLICISPSAPAPAVGGRSQGRPLSAQSALAPESPGMDCTQTDREKLEASKLLLPPAPPSERPTVTEIIHQQARRVCR